jgi:malate dehydrogenase (oxaloacetate-decarboxylating)(NADP+)
MIENRLKESLNIPVFHDDQHGTAIIAGAGLINALELVGKKFADVRLVVNGAGASGISCAKFYNQLGVQMKNITMCDSKGVIYKGRTANMNADKEEFSSETSARTLAEALEGADIFLGLSIGGCVSKEMVKSMAERPIIFAMANPNPEITYEDVLEVRPEAIMATGRSDYPNQINNVLGFPFIFRGALDVRATTINEEMKMAAARSLAALAREEVPASVLEAYGLEKLEFGPEYIIPKPFDPRVFVWESAAVAEAAMESGVARIRIDIAEYRSNLQKRLDTGF